MYRFCHICDLLQTDDVMMPVKDGFTTCREIKTNPATSQTVVIMLTAKVENEDVIAGIEAGVLPASPE